MIFKHIVLTIFMKKIINLALVFLLISPMFVSADGMIHVEDQYMHSWKIHDEKQQLCVINYENGYQKMILAVDTDSINPKEKAVWIFPVPASPDETVIDVLEGFPNLWGENVEVLSDKKISDIFSIARLSQIYTFPLFNLNYGIISNAGVLEATSKSRSLGGVDGVSIYEHIQKYGVTTEIVGARDGKSLYNYLTRTRGLTLPDSSKSVLDEYTGGDYSFVISWFSGKENDSDYGYPYTLGVSLTFPTDKIYFPLKPTSIYGSKRVPAVIYVMGYVTPNLYPSIKSDSQVSYFISSYYSPPYELMDFFNKKDVKGLKYTKIEINSPSKYLTQDLTMENTVPRKIILDTLIIQYTLIFGVFLFALTSCLASIISGIAIFRNNKPSPIKFALFGLWNFLTIIGFSIAALSIRTKKIEPEMEEKIRNLGLKIWDGRKIFFICLFSILFLILTVLFQVILQYIF